MAALDASDPDGGRGASCRGAHAPSPAATITTRRTTSKARGRPTSASCATSAARRSRTPQVILRPKMGEPVTIKTNVLGLYRSHVNKDVVPDDVQVSCEKSGYKQTKVYRRTPPGAKDMFIETECTLQRLAKTAWSDASATARLFGRLDLVLALSRVSCLARSLCSGCAQRAKRPTPSSSTARSSSTDARARAGAGGARRQDRGDRQFGRHPRARRARHPRHRSRRPHRHPRPDRFPHPRHPRRA